VVPARHTAREDLEHHPLRHALAQNHELPLRLKEQQIVEWGEADAVSTERKHAYTKALFTAALPIDFDGPNENIVLTGEVPSPLDPPNGCRFHPRCPYVIPCCATERPALRTDSGRLVACHLYDSTPP